MRQIVAGKEKKAPAGLDSFRSALMRAHGKTTGELSCD